MINGKILQPIVRKPLIAILLTTNLWIICWLFDSLSLLNLNLKKVNIYMPSEIALRSTHSHKNHKIREQRKFCNKIIFFLFLNCIKVSLHLITIKIINISETPYCRCIILKFYVEKTQLNTNTQQLLFLIKSESILYVLSLSLVLFTIYVFYIHSFISLPNNE